MTTVTAELNPLRAVVSGVAIPVSSSAQPALRPPIPAGNWWPTAGYSGYEEMPSVDGDTVWGGFMCPEAMTIVTAAMTIVTPADTGTLRIGFWAPHAEAPHQPGALIADAGTIDPTTSGTKMISGLTAALPAGLVFVSVTAVGNAATAAQMTSGVPVLLSFESVPSDAGASSCYLADSINSAALPANAPTVLTAAYIFTAPLLVLQRLATGGGEG